MPTTTPDALRLDEHGRASLDGTWELVVGDHPREELERLPGEPIVVPGLWEAQGHLDLDGVAWYRRRLVVDDADGWWTLRFGAVMDVAEVYLNGVLLGRHEHPFTPFELDPTGVLRTGENLLEVRVVDPPVDDPFHIRSAHGKQGWANHVFPSRPSLYMTYGGIWQPVVVRRHGPVTTRDLVVLGDPDDLRVSVEVGNRSTDPRTAEVGVRLLDRVLERRVELAPGETRVLDLEAGPTRAARWTPHDPVLHELLADVQVDGALSDRRRIRVGLRTVRLEGTRLLLNGEPYRMKSALVQGFRAEELYAEGSREAIVEEVLAARDAGFTMLRLHIKAFDPVYLDVCDELGMLVHCDLPVAEPIAHEELGDGTELSRRCVDAVQEQVRRDRNHPCVVLWSAMNELGLEHEGSRQWDVYEQFARTLYAAVADLDPTRPVIENDWIDPEPDRVFCSPVLTAHWYGRLHADYLAQLERQVVEGLQWGRPLYVTEFGDWGLPDMPLLPVAPFWDTRDVYAAGLAGTLWPSTIARFVRETQRYQGLSDRLQMEVMRRHDGLGGYCLTELTDVPHELNGLLDLHRRPKPLAVEEVRRGNQTVLPVLVLPSLVVEAGSVVEAPLHVANDGPALHDVVVHLRVGAATRPREDVELPAGRERRRGRRAGVVHAGALEAHRAVQVGTASFQVPDAPGNHDLVVVLSSEGRPVAENRYPLHVVAPPRAEHAVALVGGGDTAAALDAVGAQVVPEAHVLVVAEAGLDAAGGRAAAAVLASGGAVLVLAQEPEAAQHLPVDAVLTAVETAWGSSVFHFTTDSGALPSLPRRNVLVAEESTVQARSVVVGVAGRPFPDEPVVIAYKPVPGSLTGTVVGEQGVGPGRLLLCQYRLTSRAAAGDAAARALLADLVRWAAAPRRPLGRQVVRRPDGRELSFYDLPEGP